MKTTREWINTIKDKTVREMLFNNIHPHSLKNNYGSMWELLYQEFKWALTPQGQSFWEAIYLHFREGSGHKTFDDFKHLLPREELKKYNSPKPVRVAKVQLGKEYPKEFKWKIPRDFISELREGYGLSSAMMDKVFGQKPGRWNRLELGLGKQTPEDKKMIVQAMNATLILEKAGALGSEFRRSNKYEFSSLTRRVAILKKMEELKRFLKMYY